MNPQSDRRFAVRVVVAFALVYVIWGSTYFAIRVTLDSIPPAVSAALRFTIAGPLVLVILRLSGQRIAVPLRELRSLATIGCLLLVVGNGLVVWAEQYVTSGLAALMVATVPLWIAILGAVLPHGERLPPVGWAGVLLGLLGLSALLWPELAAGVRAELYGVAALLVATLSWASGSLYSKRRTFTVPPLVATGWEMLCAGIILTLIAATTGGFAHFAPTRDALLALAYLIILGSCVAFSAFIWLLHHVAAAKGTTYAYVNPVIAVFLGCIFLGEPFTASMAIGTPIIIAAVALVTSAKIGAVRAPANDSRAASARTAA